VEEAVIYETYQCSLDNGLIEYGYCFKHEDRPDDSIFDLVLGAYNPAMPEAEASATKDWAEYEWAAEAIVVAAAP
jgi:hypothetical protein